MSYHRRLPPKHDTRPKGERVCSCGCGRLVPKGRQNWASNECVKEWKIRNDPGTASYYVFQRDKGICALCGANTEALKAAYKKARDEIKIKFPFRSAPIDDHDVDAWTRYNRALREMTAAVHPKDFPTSTLRSWWEADHIVPVCEGGGQCGLDGLRTLCCACHKRVTAELAGRRAKAKKPNDQQKELPLRSD